MHKRTCSVPQCGRNAEYRLYCRPHYRRWKATGDVGADRPLRILPRDVDKDDVATRILSRCETDAVSGCIVWTGATAHGYGKICWRGRAWQAHRAIWTVQVGPIPDDDDWTIDHLCRNRACQNVEHMEVVTRIENTRRGGGLAIAQAKNKARAHCPNGHRYTPGTTYHTASGQRYCKVCKLNAWAKRRTLNSDSRRANYRARRDAGATPYQALHVRWWEYPTERPA